MGLMNKFVIFILSSIAIFLIVMLSMSLALNSLLYPQVYSNSLEKAGVYSYLDEGLAQTPGATFIETSQGGYKGIVDGAILEVLSYIRSEKDTLEIKVKVDRNKLRNFFLDSVGNLTECKQGQDPFGKNPCLPKGTTPEQFLDDFLENNNITLLEDDTVDLTSIYGLEQGSEGRQALDNLRDYVSYYKKSIVIIIVMLIAIISLIFILQGSKFKPSLKTMSRIFILSSLTLFLIQYTIINLPSSINQTDELFTRLIFSITDVVANKVGFYAIVIGVIAIILFISSLVIKEEQVKVKTTKVKETKK